ncbi:hypothetical protein RHMOL_Rhmol09G0268200 [Rhododendron molle]|uniref:Uncharacterized protein n=1 Tax=Rhododendron molle TaxID=49168 RepID=A0ACC0MJK5_RHOML|nr:hypothetical protein RHMOL_Rhmol09G0268200 [Rhododendron molle]
MRNASDFSCSPSSSSNPESYVGPGDAAIKSDQTIPGCMPKMPCNCKSESNLWPHLQPTCGHQKDFSHEQLNALELETLSANCFDEIVKFGVPKNKDMGEFWHIDDQLMNLDSFDLACEEPKKLGSELESHWIGAEKTGPWWRKAGKDELASLVFLKSLENVENCDLPPQTEKFGRAASARPHCFYHRKIVDSFLDQVADKGISNLANYAQLSPNSGSMDETHCTLSDFGGLPFGLDDPFRPTSFSNNGPNKINMDKRETPQQPGADLSKDELLEALCHSQTRAREAEKAAQEASNEKDHIVKLFFRQASHLFAYRQWFQILQLENFCLQLKNHDHLASVQFPGFLPWAPFKRRQARKGRHKAAKRKGPKGSPPGHKISKCGVAFALGLSLAGAGLFLGWTMGWFFPSL